MKNINKHPITLMVRRSGVGSPTLLSSMYRGQYIVTDIGDEKNNNTLALA